MWRAAAFSALPVVDQYVIGLSRWWRLDLGNLQLCRMIPSRHCRRAWHRLTRSQSLYDHSELLKQESRWTKSSLARLHALTRCSSPARLSSRNPLAQARNRNLTSSGPQDWGPDPTNHSTHLGPSFLSLPRTTPLPPRLESPQLQLAFPSSPEKPLPTLIQAQICLKFTPQTTQTPRQPIFFANPPVTPARFRVGPLLESFFNTELRFLHNPG